MIYVKNKYFPFDGWLATTVWPFIFHRKELSDVDKNHEEIHGRQQIELLCIIFLILYFLEWFIKLFIYGKKAYRNISFEREAYLFEKYNNYLKARKHFNWIRYVI